MEITIQGHRVYDCTRELTQTINISGQGMPRGQEYCIYVYQFQRPFVSEDELRAKAVDQPTLVEFLSWLTAKGGRKRADTTKALRLIAGPSEVSVSRSGSPPPLPLEPKKAPDVTEDAPLIDPIYLPFTVHRFRKHFAPVGGDNQEIEDDRHLRYYLSSARRYDKFRAEYPSRRGLPIASMCKPCQIERDERFWIAGCLLKFYYSVNRIDLIARLLSTCYGETPPVGLSTWKECHGEHDHLEIYFEANLPSPPSYKKWLRTNLEARNIIPYVKDATWLPGVDATRAHLEGPTHVDALLLNKTNGFAVLFEAKVLSDISSQVSFDVTRNQIVRSVDVMLEKNPFLAEPLKVRDPALSLFVLLTPEIFKEKSHTRLYGWLINLYKNDSVTLEHDMPHRKETIEWSNLSKRLGWLTWEDCEEVLPDSCPWLRD